MRGLLLALLLALACLALVAVVLVSEPVEATSRGGIRINDNGGFTAANGVVSGNGTAGDPYVISDWEIYDTRDGLLVEQTTAYFVVRNLTINATDIYWAFYVNTVSNGYFENITIYGRDDLQAYIVHMSDTTVRNLTIQDGGNMYLRYCDNCELSDVDLEGPSFVEVGYCQDLKLIRIVSQGSSGDGLFVHQSSDISLLECNSSGHARGVKVIQCDRMVILRCDLYDNYDIDLYVDPAGSGHTIKNNSMGRRGMVVPMYSWPGIDSSNTCDGKPIQFIIDRVNVTIDGNASQVYLGNCTDVRVSNMTTAANRPVNVWASSRLEFWNITTAASDTAVATVDAHDLSIHDCDFNISSVDFYDKSGLNLEGCKDVTIRNVTIEGFVTQAGIEVSGGKGSTALSRLENVTVSTRGARGLSLWDTDATVIEGCTVSSGGIYVHNARTALVANCTSPGGRVRIDGVSSGTVRGTTVVVGSGYRGIDIAATTAEATGNRVSGGNAGVYAEATSGTFNDNTVWDCYYGYLLMVPNARCDGNVADACDIGDRVMSGGHVFVNGHITNCTTAGIKVEASNAYIGGTTVSHADGTGILVDSPTSSISGVTVTKCVITWCGVGLRTVESSGTYTFNVIQNCTGYGIVLNGGSNVAHHNSLMQNNLGGVQASNGGNNQFDNGVKGNYWADYRTRYPGARPIAGGVWDTPYQLDGSTGLTDRYPLVNDIDIFPPVARAGPDVAVDQNSTVSFDGRSSSDNLGIVGYAWSFVYDDRAQNLSGSTATFTFDLPGVYTVTLIVWDHAANYAFDTLVVTVRDTEAPVPVIATNVVADMSEMFHLDASGSRDNDEIVGYLWIIDPDGLNITRTTATFSLFINDAGTYNGTLTLTDATGNEATANFTITIRDVVSPVAKAGPDVTVGQGEDVTFDGSASTDNVGVVAWRWLIETYSGTVTLSGVRPTYAFNESGTFSVTLEVSDAAGRKAIDKLVVTVLDTEAPVARAGVDVFVDQGSTVTLDGRASTDNEEIASYDWSFEYDGDTVNLTGGQVTWEFILAGVYDVVLGVEDVRGNRAEDTVRVTVWDTTAPTADAGGDRTVDQGGELVLDGGASFDNVAIVEWEWWIDGPSGSVKLEGARVTYTFEEVADYLVTLVVRDAVELEDDDTITVTVLDTEDPVADAGPDAFVLVGDTFQFDGSASRDNVGVTSYLWSFQFGGSGRTLSGERPSFLFDQVGVFTVTLEVRDAGGNAATDTVVIVVKPESVTWALGPVLDGDGRPVEGAKVRVVLGGVTYTGRTNAEGWVHLEVKWADLSSPANVTITKDGYKDMVFDLPLDAEGSPAGDIPPMVVGEGGDGSSSLGTAVIVIAVVAVVAALVAVVAFMRRRGA